MKKSVETIGKTIEEAVRKGLEELKVSKDDVIIEVIESPKSGGILGVLSQKLAKVRLVVDKKISSEIKEITINRIKSILNEMFDVVKEKVEIQIDGNDKQVVVNLNLENPKYLIGHKGKTIEALQSLLNSFLQLENKEYCKVFVEVNGYKKAKEEKLKRLANKMADNVIKFKKSIRLEPMSSYERMIVHTELSKNEDVITESFGEEPNRRLVIRRKY